MQWWQPLKHYTIIREQDPLKQGLKHSPVVLNDKNSVIREQDPLKQGLKQKPEGVRLFELP